MKFHHIQFSTNFRSTDKFEIKVSNATDGPFSSVVSDRMENALNKPCSDIKLEIFSLESPVEARYVEFHITSYFDYSGGLQYFSFIGEYNGGMEFYSLWHRSGFVTVTNMSYRYER